MPIFAGPWIAAAFAALEGQFVVDLGIEHIFFPGGYAKKMRIPAGHKVGQHKHTTAHYSAYSGGPVLVRTDTGFQELDKGYGGITMPAHVHHEIEAQGDVLWFCIWETDETDPEKIDATVIERT